MLMHCFCHLLISRNHLLFFRIFFFSLLFKHFPIFRSFLPIFLCVRFLCAVVIYRFFLLNVIYLSASRCQIDVEFQRKKSNNILHSDPFGRKMHSASFDTVIGQNWLLAHKIHYDIYQIRTLFKRDLPQSSTLWPGYFWMHDTFMIVTSCMSWS